jgi:hypothetical protein
VNASSTSRAAYISLVSSESSTTRARGPRRTADACPPPHSFDARGMPATCPRRRRVP